jgi:hypothetical protein
MELPRALSMLTSRSCSIPDIFNVQHAGGIAVFICVMVFRSIYRIFTINNIRPKMGLSTPFIIIFILFSKLFDEYLFIR